VTDTGGGIASEIIDRVFEPFSTTKPVGQGTGLGLRQVYGFCKRAGGTVAITSAPAAGTSVTMLIPAAQRVDATSPLEPASSSQCDLSGVHILLVDDNPEVAQATREVLVSAGATVRVAADAPMAITEMTDCAGKYDLLLSDIVMPGAMDGIALARYTRSHWPEISVLLTTGESHRLEDASRLNLHVLPKPSDPLVLLGKIGTVLSGRPARQNDSLLRHLSGRNSAVNAYLSFFVCLLAQIRVRRLR
jgi:two-component system, NtrC family, sensor kinase